MATEKPPRFKIKTASYYRTGEVNEAGEAIYHIRLYAEGRMESSMSVTATLLQQQLGVIREQGYTINRLNLS